ncbi:selenophosphate synthase [Balneicella halophila]|uniref:Selenide, water dikinase n=1 Tax=Balneicella halophila TaxID=1537566 RepID=A0A7L4UQ43_BALHA|nr:selenide, water dikinase SelD [Balneicella halophila]PVX51863.1 selenophosphate synthase [Balneicella halophila]
MEQIKLTQYSHGAGCGCKISPKVLSTILHSETKKENYTQLLVGNDSRDDAAVYDLGDGTAIISTTDFFMPIVDDPFSFGRIAAANAISDVYAMGGDPLLAIAILGWPVDKLAPEVAQQVLEGGRSICTEAGIPLAGGHSIDSPEPIFGLAVTGRVAIKDLKQNDTAEKGCQLFITKPLGVGVLSTAQKQGKLKEEDANIAPNTMMELNKIGQKLSKISGIKAMTDVTGFGLLGHLVEMCEGSNLSAEIYLDKVPLLPKVHEYLDQGCIPGGTHRNWASYGDKVKLSSEKDKFILCDPQTSGGLMIAVESSAVEEVKSLLAKENIHVQSFGKLIERKEDLITVK